MADFLQTGDVATLHDLRHRPVEDLEAALMAARAHRPMGLILPSLYSELEGPALSGIVDTLCEVPYLDQVVVGLDQADETQYRNALAFFERMPQRPDVLWHDGPRLRAVDALLREHGLSPDRPGKGRNVWFLFGWVLATGRAEAIALHDCDILTYDRALLARLFLPVAHPTFSYTFCKGYYARVADGKMNGRVCRLLVTPLLRALRTVCGDHAFLGYLDSFRYPLAGEFSLHRSVLESLRIPSDWGLEMGVLAEVYRNHALARVCQVELADTYDHKHQDLSPDDRAAGLSKMSTDIALALFRKLATQGQVFSKSRIRSIKAAYYREALDLVDRYHDDAQFNGLRYDRHREMQAVEVFAENVLHAGHTFLDAPMAPPFMPSWRRVLSAVPDVFERLVDAVDADRKQFGSSRPADPLRHPQAQRLRQRAALHLGALYGEDQAAALTERLLREAGVQGHTPVTRARANKWDERDVLAITYGDTVIADDEAPLRTLRRVFDRWLGNTIPDVHILPFFPSSSDDGFSVVDYLAVHPALGTWEDVRAIASEYRLMADVVLNHCSASSPWFQQYLRGQAPGRDYFIEIPEDADLSEVVRPRSSPLRTRVQTADGPRDVWCTFSADQVDLDFSNPEVLFEFVRVLRHHVAQGVRVFRLDAVAFLWKEAGSPCVHLPQTHRLIKLLRLVLETMDPRTVVVTETNVPLLENLSYFGNGNEAHVVYNFSLPPLVVHALLAGTSAHLRAWAVAMPPARQGTAYLNFLASHDGIGVRPIEGLLNADDLDALLDTLRGFGGHVSTRRLANGEDAPYEVNIALFDALQGTLAGGPDDHGVARFVCAHTIMLALEGIPAFYLHSLFGTRNDVARVELTGRARSINRHQWRFEDLEHALADPASHHAAVFSALRARIAVRREQPAFHPNATQYTLQLGDAVFAFWRESLDRDQSIFALHNVTDRPQEVALLSLNLIPGERWRDLLSGEGIDDPTGTCTLPPYGCVWITNR